MPDFPEPRKKLEALASPLPWKDGFHLGMRDNPNAVELEIGQMLYWAVLERKPEHVVELGTGPGYSTCWILLGLEHNEHGKLWTVDVSSPERPVWQEIGLPTGRLVVIANSPIDYTIKELPQFGPALPERIDFLFHDASHCFDEIQRDLLSLMPRIPAGGHILIHDVNYRRKMGDELDTWFDSMPEDWSYQEMSSSCGIGIARRLKSPEPIPKPKKRRIKSGT